MPPRYAYWTILVDGGPTAFRAAEPDELLPTLKRLQVKQPGATMKWFEKGRLWDTREEAREKLSAGYTVGPDGALVPPAEGAERRTKGWRPGGEHRDPREKYQLAKKAKWQKFKKMVRARPGHGPKPDDGPLAPPGTSDGPGDDTPIDRAHDGSQPADAPPPDAPPPSTDWRGRSKPGGRAPAAKRGWSDRAKTFDRGGDRERGPKPAWRDRPKTFDRGSDRPRGPKPEWTGPRPENRGPRPDWKGPRPESRGPKPEWRDKPKGDWQDRPKPAWRDRPNPPDRGGDRPRGPKPDWKGPRPDSRGPRPEWRDKPKGDWQDRPKPAWRDRPKPPDRGDDRPRGPKPDWKGPRPESRGPKPEWKGARPESRGPKPEWKGPRPERRGPKPEWKGARPENRGPKPEWRDRPKGDGRGNDRTRAPKAGDRPRGPKPEWRGPSAGGFKPRGRKPSGPPRKKG